MSTSKKDETKSEIQNSKAPIYWIPFSIAAVFLVGIGLFRFPSSEDNAYFIYICLIAFALAALPWIRSFRVNGLFEIERTIEKTKEETKDRIEQTEKRFEDRIFSLRAELMASLTSIQSQVSQQSAVLNSTQSQLSQQSAVQASSNSQIINVGYTVKEALEKSSENGDLSQNKGVEEVKKISEIELSKSDINELKTGFAQSAAAALDDPLGVQCSKLIEQIPNSGISLSEFNELQSKAGITNEQLQTLKKLKIITFTPSETEKDKRVKVTNLGKLYSDYWKISANVSSWASILSPIFPFISTTLLASILSNKMAKRENPEKE